MLLTMFPAVHSPNMNTNHICYNTTDSNLICIPWISAAPCLTISLISFASSNLPGDTRRFEGKPMFLCSPSNCKIVPLCLAVTVVELWILLFQISVEVGVLTSQPQRPCVVTPFCAFNGKQVVLAGKCVLKYVSQALFGLSPLSQTNYWKTILEKGKQSLFH